MVLSKNEKIDIIRTVKQDNKIKEFTGTYFLLKIVYFSYYLITFL